MSRVRSATAAAIVLMGFGAGLSANAALPNCPAPAGRVAVGVAPPPVLPADPQPPIPAYGYIWTPGYWAWDPSVNDYYWIPGAWEAPPAIGLFWTPGYWGWVDGVYIFNTGYWGPHVGFYGGINYGFGYFGHGYEGGYWQGRTFYYNRTVNRLGNLQVNAAYTRPVAGRLSSRTSFSGGPGGVRAQPTAAELAAGREAHLAATTNQAAHAQQAAMNPGMRAGLTHGHPRLAAVAVGVAAVGVAHVAAHAAAAHSMAHATGHATFRPTTHAEGFDHQAARGGGFEHQSNLGAERRGGGGFAAPRGEAHVEAARGRAAEGGARPASGGGERHPR